MFSFSTFFFDKSSQLSKKSHNGLHIAESTKFIRKNNGGKKKQREAEPKIIQLGLIKIDFHKWGA